MSVFVRHFLRSNEGGGVLNAAHREFKQICIANEKVNERIHIDMKNYGTICHVGKILMC